VLVIEWQVGQQWQVELYDAASGQWSVGGPVPGLEYVYTATVLLDGSVLVTGTAQGRSGSAAQRYDPSSGVWADAGAMLALPGERQSATALTDGRVLVVAERGGAELYLPTANRWVSTSPAGSGYWPVARLADGRVLAVGGARLGMQRTGAALFDPGSEHWADTAPMTSEHPGTSGVLLADGRVIIADVNGAEIFEP
jgi:hypothetical protein